MGTNLLDGWFAVRVPCCRGWRWRLHARRLLTSFFTLFIVAMGSLFGVLLGTPSVFRQLGRPAPTIEWVCAGALAVSVACSIGLYLWGRHSPAWFTLEISGDSVDYQFLSESYANEFSRLNADVPEQKGIIAPLSEEQVASLQRGAS